MDDKRARFEMQVVPHLDAAYRFARWLTGTPADADDIVQDAFLRAFRGFHTLRSEDARAWLLSIVRNCHSSAYRQGRRGTFVPVPEDSAPEALTSQAPGPEAESLRRDGQRTLERLMRQLPSEQREVLALRELEEMSYHDIAMVTGVPIGTVMSRLARARGALRERWLAIAEEVPRAVR
jgi:RNA polymerase sigma-70 factor (ECF subfamily)